VLFGDATEFHRRPVGVFWQPPCRPSMSQAPLPSRQKSRLIRQDWPQGMPCCSATPQNFTAAP
jgi:hypothetical protein